jgi:hypothetical protein
MAADGAENLLPLSCPGCGDVQSVENAQVVPKAAGVSIDKEAFRLPMSALPNRNGTSEQTRALARGFCPPA